MIEPEYLQYAVSDRHIEDSSLRPYTCKLMAFKLQTILMDTFLCIFLLELKRLSNKYATKCHHI